MLTSEGYCFWIENSDLTLLLFHNFIMFCHLLLVLQLLIQNLLFQLFTLYNISFLSECFQNSPMSSVFKSLTMICLDIDFFKFFLFGVQSVSDNYLWVFWLVGWLVGWLVLPKSGTFQFFNKYFFSPVFFYFSV